METIIRASEIEEITPYSSRRLPDGLSDRFSTFVHSSFDDLHTHRPARVDVIVATPATRWSADGQSVTLYTFARFRRYFTVIEDLATALAPGYLQSGVLPVVAPIRAHARRRTFEVNPALLRYITKEGLKLYTSRHG